MDSGGENWNYVRPTGGRNKEAIVAWVLGFDATMRPGTLDARGLRDWSKGLFWGRKARQCVLEGNLRLWRRLRLHCQPEGADGKTDSCLEREIGRARRIKIATME